MDIKQTKSEGLTKEFDITLSAAEISRNMEQKLNQVGQSAKIPGFRPGKIPLSVLKQRYQGSVTQDVIEQSLQEAKRQLIEEQKLRVALEPQFDVDLDNYKEGEDLKLKVTLEVLPDIEKVDLKKFDFEYLETDVGEEEILKALDTLRQRKATLKDAEAGTIAKTGSTVHLAFKGTMANGKPITGGSSEGMDLELGSGSFIPGFEDQLIGLKEGDHKEFDINFPEDYQAKDLAGQRTHFAVDIKKVKEKEASELSDDFAREMGKETLDELKKAMSEHLLSDYKAMSLLDSKRKILDKFSETFDFDIPEGLKELEFKSIWNQVQNENQSSSQETSEDKSFSEEEEKQYRDIAERRVRLGLLLAEIGREHNVNVNQKELEQAIVQEAMKYPGMERKVIDYYRQNTNAQAALRAPLFEDKVIEVILKEANVKKTKIPYEDLKKRIHEITEGEGY